METARPLKLIDSRNSGFTLLELLVVTAVMAIIGAYSIANYVSFGENQKLKNAAADLQNFFRLAQSNATTGLKCQNQGALGWIVEYADSTNLYLKCLYSEPEELSVTLKTLTFTGSISIQSINIGVNPCSFGTTFKYAPLYGTMTSTCGGSSTATVTLRNIKTGATEVLNIEPGGRVYGQ